MGCIGFVALAWALCTVSAQFLPTDDNVPQLPVQNPGRESLRRLLQVEEQALLEIASQLQPTALNTETVVSTWINGTNPCNWVGTLLACTRHVGHMNRTLTVTPTQEYIATVRQLYMTQHWCHAPQKQILGQRMCMHWISRGGPPIEAMGGHPCRAPSPLPLVHLGSCATFPHATTCMI